MVLSAQSKSRDHSPLSFTVTPTTFIQFVQKLCAHLSTKNSNIRVQRYLLLVSKYTCICCLMFFKLCWVLNINLWEIYGTLPYFPRSHLEEGLSQLRKTNRDVDIMRGELNELHPGVTLKTKVCYKALSIHFNNSFRKWKSFYASWLWNNSSSTLWELQLPRREQPLLWKLNKFSFWKRYWFEMLIIIRWSSQCVATRCM